MHHPVGRMGGEGRCGVAVYEEAAASSYILLPSSSRDPVHFDVMSYLPTIMMNDGWNA